MMQSEIQEFDFQKGEILVFDKATGQGVAGVEVKSDCLTRNTKFITNVDGRS